MIIYSMLITSIGRLNFCQWCNWRGSWCQTQICFKSHIDICHNLCSRIILILWVQGALLSYVPHRLYRILADKEFTRFELFQIYCRNINNDYMILTLQMNNREKYSLMYSLWWKNVRTYFLSQIPEQCQGELISGSPELTNFASEFAGLSLRVGMPPPNKPVEESPRCPCGCLQHGEAGGFRTRELSSMRLVVHGPEILNYQGTRQAPEDVAPYWKKDSRMWLWKSVRLARRGNRSRMRLGTAFVDSN